MSPRISHLSLRKARLSLSAAAHSVAEPPAFNVSTTFNRFNVGLLLIGTNEEFQQFTFTVVHGHLINHWFLLLLLSVILLWSIRRQS